MAPIRQLRNYLIGLLWPQEEPVPLPRYRLWLRTTSRIGYLTVRDVAKPEFRLHAMGLVYTTLLSMVPLLAFSFSILKGMGVHYQVEPYLLKMLEPIGPKSIEITSRIMDFVANTNVGVLGTVGLGVLIYTVTSLLQKTERAFNTVWRVQRGRSMVRRMSGYLSVLLLGPVLLIIAVGATASLADNAIAQKLIAYLGLGPTLKLMGEAVPYVAIIFAFTLVFMFIPNTKVRFGSALIGAIIAGLLWKALGWSFAAFVVGSTKYTAIYSGFAVLIFFMIWLYLNWLVLLIGASVAFYHQHSEYLSTPVHGNKLSNRAKEKLALFIMVLVARNYYHNEPAWNCETLAQTINVPREYIDDVCAILQQASILDSTNDEAASFLPARPLDTLDIKTLLQAVRASGEETGLAYTRIRHDPSVDQWLQELDHIMQNKLTQQTIKQLALPPDA